MDITAQESTDALLTMGLDELISRADKVRKDYIGDKLHLCSIVNAKSGLCNQDCKFCAQSGKHSTNIESFALITKERIVEAARQARDIGAHSFGIVTSGNRLSEKELDTVAGAVCEIKNKVGIAPCASLGALEQSQLEFLKDAGLSRYHHNIETSQRFYPKIVSTHKYEQRIETVRAAKAVGLEVCSGGIIGLGENWQDRIDMARTLKELDVDSVPINMLVPVEGTPLESVEPVSAEDAIRTICIFRIILKDKTIKIAAGREVTLKDCQLKGFRAGANGMLIGGYLTVKGAGLQADYVLIEEIKKLWTE